LAVKNRERQKERKRAKKEGRKKERRETVFKQPSSTAEIR